MPHLPCPDTPHRQPRYESTNTAPLQPKISAEYSTAPGNGRQAPVSTQLDGILQEQSPAVAEPLSGLPPIVPSLEQTRVYPSSGDRHCISVLHPDFQSSSQNCYFNETGNKSIVLNSLRGERDQEAEAGLVTTLPCFISLS